jgi:hypothetical protein
MKIIEARKAETTIKRPDGRIDIGIHPKIDYFTPGLFAQMQKAMMDAGRGEVISYRNIEAVVEMEESDYQTRCTRCGKQIDTRTAKHQREWTRFGGSKVQVDAHYCDGCFSLLRSIGAGERTELEERAGYVPSYELTTKTDF